MESDHDLSRRTFLGAVGAVVPTLKLVLDGTSADLLGAEDWAAQAATGKFSPIDLAAHFTASSADFGPKAESRGIVPGTTDDLVRVPSGQRVLRGIPFQLGPAGVNEKSWVVLSTKATGGAVTGIDVPIAQQARYVCLAQFCDWDPQEAFNPPPAEDTVEKVGQPLAEVTLVYEDGSEHACPIRRRFEVNALRGVWGHLSFLSVAHRKDQTNNLTDPLANATRWGDLQLGVRHGGYPDISDPGVERMTLWLCALENPAPDRVIKALRFRATDADPLVVCGLTLYHGRENPLRYERLTLYRLTLPEPAAARDQRWKVDVDLGAVARTFQLPSFAADTWLTPPPTGAGDSFRLDVQHLYAEVAASRDATLALRDTKTGRVYEFDLDQAVSGQEVDARPAGARLEVLHPVKTWLHCRVIDTGTKRPTPVRLAFRSKEGRYIPPYGHRTEINAGWFQDYGADLALGSGQYAYVDGEFQVELPVGEVYLELSKGFEYEAARRRLDIQPGQRDLTIDVSRVADLRTRGWVSADTHVHFLSPSTAVLEGQAEGLNLVNLLAAQWGDLFTNVGDLWQGSLASRDGETVVRVGTENRQHLLGHLALLGGSAPAFPMSAGGPSESYVGDPLWSSMSEWADECRKRDGIVVAVHFPFPTGELAADIVLNKVDAVELRATTRPSSLVYQDWYRYLNCGYRLAAAGGTDKMGATTAVGANRTYAYLGKAEFNFASWAAAVRRGNTFATSGPLLLFEADGRIPGQDIEMRQGGGTVEVRAEAFGNQLIRLVEVVWNGHVVASREEPAGASKIVLQEKVKVDGPGWIAARCSALTRAGLVSAHTTPVYVKVPGRDLLSGPAATYMLTLIDGAESWARQLATRPDADRFARVLQVFADAREHLHRRLHAHGIAH